MRRVRQVLGWVTILLSKKSAELREFVCLACRDALDAEVVGIDLVVVAVDGVVDVLPRPCIVGSWCELGAEQDILCLNCCDYRRKSACELHCFLFL